MTRPYFDSLGSCSLLSPLLFVLYLNIHNGNALSNIPGSTVFNTHPCFLQPPVAYCRSPTRPLTSVCTCYNMSSMRNDDRRMAVFLYLLLRIPSSGSHRGTSTFLECSSSPFGDFDTMYGFVFSLLSPLHPPHHRPYTQLPIQPSLTQVLVLHVLTSRYKPPQIYSSP
ncbi:hypothetical protein EV361DRAFT_33362 [Lentinula raphanica]|nr:hypothetical protein EV361DRAFT_33362 [Lentinula raphanica]